MGKQHICLVDAACSLKPGEQTGQASIGVLIYRGKKLVGEYSIPVGVMRPDTAELHAIHSAILICWSAKLTNPMIVSDAKMIVQKLKGYLNNKQVNIADEHMPLMYALKNISHSYDYVLAFEKRRYLDNSDALAKATLEQYMKDMFFDE